MDEADDKLKKPTPPRREISNANLFADDIVFSDTEKILFSEDLHESTSADLHGLMDGNPATRYSVVKKLNEGGMKAIWEVDDRRTARKVAMALIQAEKIASQKDIAAFLYEARLTSNLQHPNIIPIYDIALDENGNPYFTMKALKGETLNDILKAGSQTRTRLLGIFLKVCNAIAYAHAKGVIHLDLKPSNIIVGEYGDVHVLDWGLAILVTQPGETNPRDIVGGTPGYMAPEQAQNTPGEITFQTDVYMLGAILYEILTRHCPIEGGTTKDVLQKTVRGEIPSPSQYAPQQKIPGALAAIAMKALATEPAERYANVAALIHDLQQYQDGFATRAENPTFVTHLILLVKRHKMVVSLIAASLAVIFAVLANSFSKIKQSEQVAVGALATLQEKNDYIAATAKKVAPTYLNLMAREEPRYAFDAAEEALNTSLAFDPSNGLAWLQKGSILLCQQQFSKAWTILSGHHGHPVKKNTSTLAMAEKYKDTGPLSDPEIPQLVRDFINRNMSGGIPRLFYHLNRAPFDPSTRFPAIEASLKLLNPRVENLNFSWKDSPSKGWKIDLSDNPNLDDISPLCGLNIHSLNASGIGVPDLKLLTENGLKDLQLSGTALNHLFELDQLTGLRTLDISGTRIRNLTNIVKYPKLTSLDISGIKGLSISPQLIWCRNLNLLTVSDKFKGDPTIRALANRGVIIIYTEK